MLAMAGRGIILRGGETRNRPALRGPSRRLSADKRRTALGRQGRARSAEIVKHTVSWNGHHLVGTLVALLVGMGFVALRFPTDGGWVNVPFHAAAPVSATSSDSGRCPEDTCPSPGPSRTVDSTELVLSSCQKLHKAIQNGNEAAIVSSMKVVIADGTVDDTSRKVARHYTVQDKGNESKQNRNLLILRDSCKS